MDPPGWKISRFLMHPRRWLPGDRTGAGFGIWAIGPRRIAAAQVPATDTLASRARQASKGFSRQ